MKKCLCIQLILISLMTMLLGCSDKKNADDPRSHVDAQKITGHDVRPFNCEVQQWL